MAVGREERHRVGKREIQGAYRLYRALQGNIRLDSPSGLY
jgi:hypothetical protein